jgi:hypothetical protein
MDLLSMNFVAANIVRSAQMNGMEGLESEIEAISHDYYRIFGLGKSLSSQLQ